MEKKIKLLIDVIHWVGCARGCASPEKGSGVGEDNCLPFKQRLLGGAFSHTASGCCFRSDAIVYFRHPFAGATQCTQRYQVFQGVCLSFRLRWLGCRVQLAPAFRGGWLALFSQTHTHTLSALTFSTLQKWVKHTTSTVDGGDDASDAIF